ncbi:MAG: hypothetical protein JW789_00400 [Candidatus Aenigmarchaeota archaeon]|nr:hypothetical protein [Candidatus Aenigmarchaeota archaeon]
MSKIITFDDVRKIYDDVVNLYIQKGLGEYNPEGRRWFDESFMNVEMMMKNYGGQLSFEKIKPNTIATQPDISREKYDFLSARLDEVDFEMFPIVSIEVPGYGRSGMHEASIDGHTRSRLCVDKRPYYIDSFVFSGKDPAIIGEIMINTNMSRMGVYRPARISQLPIKEYWNNNGIISEHS